MLGLKGKLGRHSNTKEGGAWRTFSGPDYIFFFLCHIYISFCSLLTQRTSYFKTHSGKVGYNMHLLFLISTKPKPN